MKRDIEYIKEQFEGDGLKAPESLSEDAMMAKLAAVEPEPARKSIISRRIRRSRSVSVIRR